MSLMVLKIGVDDKGNPALLDLDNNIRKVKKSAAATGDIFKATFLATGIVKGIQMIGGAFRAVSDDILGFDKAMKSIEGVTQISGAPLKEFREAARQMALETEHSAKSIAETMLEVTKMGFEPDATLKAMPGILDLATASMSELGYAATNSINIIKAFNMGNDEMGRVANVVAVALNKTSLDLENYMEGLKHVAPISSRLGVSFEETTAILGTFADIGIRGSLAGTTLKNMMLNLLRTTPAVTAALADMDVKSMDLSQVLDVLAKKKISVSDMLDQFAKRGVVGALAIGDLGESTATLRKELEAQGLTAKEVAEVIRGSLINRLLNLKNAFIDLGLTAIDVFGGVAGDAIGFFRDKLVELGEYWKANSEEMKTKFLAWKDAVVTAIDVVIKTISFLVAAIKPLIAAFTAFYMVNFHLVIAAITAAMGPAIASVTAMTIAAGPLTIAIMAVVAAYQFATDAVNKWSAAIDKANENVATEWNSKKHKEHLEAIIAGYDRINKAQSMAGTGREAYKELLAAKEAQKQIIKEYNKDFNASGNKFVTDEAVVRRNLASIKELELQKKNNKEKEKAVDLAAQLKKLYGQNVTANPSSVKAAKDEFGKLEKDAARISKELDDSYASGALMQLKAQRDDYKEAEDKLKRGDKYQNKRNKKITEELKILNKRYDEEMDRDKQAFQDRATFIAAAHQGMTDVMSAISEAYFAKEQRLWDKKTKIVEDAYAKELGMAQGSAFKKAVAQEKYEMKMEELAKARTAANKQLAIREARMTMAIAYANAFAASIAAIAETRGGFMTKMAAGAIVLSNALGLVASTVSAVSQIQGARNGEIISGSGNATSDNLVRRVSPGEAILSKNNVDSLGGEQGLRKLLDRSASYSSNSSVTVHIDNFIGTREFAREMVPIIKKEISR